jgi:hypothetical protein
MFTHRVDMQTLRQTPAGVKRTTPQQNAFNQGITGQSADVEEFTRHELYWKPPITQRTLSPGFVLSLLNNQHLVIATSTAHQGVVRDISQERGGSSLATSPRDRTRHWCAERDNITRTRVTPQDSVSAFWLDFVRNHFRARFCPPGHPHPPNTPPCNVSIEHRTPCVRNEIISQERG